mmetsp:Transcript_101514/g.160520  ORF Transcript_101514/g.160520 Transcript_101514/m.160520 type:complete len:211 (-) Transcript_101514:943-1575(-)
MRLAIELHFPSIFGISSYDGTPYFVVAMNLYLDASTDTSGITSETTCVGCKSCSAVVSASFRTKMNNNAVHPIHKHFSAPFVTSCCVRMLCFYDFGLAKIRFLFYHLLRFLDACGPSRLWLSRGIRKLLPLRIESHSIQASEYHISPARRSACQCFDQLCDVLWAQAITTSFATLHKLAVTRLADVVIATLCATVCGWRFTAQITIVTWK